VTGRRALTFTLVVLSAGSGCLPVRRVPPAEATPSAASEWSTVYAHAITEARASRISAAEKALTDFAQQHAGSPEAAEVPYWRAVLKLDPANPVGIREALALLESYLANAPTGVHRVEAETFRRLALALEQRNAALAAIPPAVVPRPDDKAREEEMQRLRDELAAANAELDRIRRRLARPRP
jgi:hypothetical protein